MIILVIILFALIGVPIIGGILIGITLRIKDSIENILPY